MIILRQFYPPVTLLNFACLIPSFINAFPTFY